MVAVSRFVEFSINAQTFATGTSTEATARGIRGFSRGTGLGPAQDSFSIGLNSNDQLAVAINGNGPRTITLCSGIGLDPRFVARDIEFKLHSADITDDSFKFAQCNWRNGNGGSNKDNSFIIYSGRLGNNTGVNKVIVTSPGGRDARTTLGFNTVTEVAGVDSASSSYTGVLTVSGVYAGQFDDFYTLMISENETVGAGTATGGNTYTGVMETGGLYTGIADDVYTITIDALTGGSMMGVGAGNVPTFVVTDAPGIDDNANPIELLFSNAWYDVGDLGVRVRFTDAVFGNGDTFTVNGFVASGTGFPKAVGTAPYIFSSEKGDSSKVHTIPAVITQTTGTQVGTRGVTVTFSDSGSLSLGETFNIICRGPQVTNSNVTQLNFGNVTVSTNSAVKIVWFELISGAVSMSTIKFSLQSDGSFQNHNQGDNDTLFHFGTVGAGNAAPGAGTQSNSQSEFPVDITGLGNVAAVDIDSDISPTFLFATRQNLAVVNSADTAENIGNFLGAVVSDFIYLAIKLGANETGANSTINYRMFFDFQ